MDRKTWTITAILCAVMLLSSISGLKLCQRVDKLEAQVQELENKNTVAPLTESRLNSKLLIFADK